MYGFQDLDHADVAFVMHLSACFLELVDLVGGRPAIIALHLQPM